MKQRAPGRYAFTGDAFLRSVVRSRCADVVNTKLGDENMFSPDLKQRRPELTLGADVEGQMQGVQGTARGCVATPPGRVDPLLGRGVRLSGRVGTVREAQMPAADVSETARAVQGTTHAVVHTVRVDAGSAHLRIRASLSPDRYHSSFDAYQPRSDAYQSWRDAKQSWPNMKDFWPDAKLGGRNTFTAASDAKRFPSKAAYPARMPSLS